ALLAPFGNADVVDAGLLAAELVEKALHHFGGLLNAFAGVRNAGLLNPLLQIQHVLIDVGVYVAEDFAESRGVDLAHVDANSFIGNRAYTEADCRRRRRNRRRSCNHAWGSGGTAWRRSRFDGCLAA